MLVVNGSLASPVTVNSGGILSGTGSLTSVTVNCGGSLAPGDSLGSLASERHLELGRARRSTTTWTESRPSNEVLMPSGQLVLSGQQFGDFNFTTSPASVPGTYDLIDAGTIIGSLGTNTSGTVGGYPATLAVQGGDLELNVTPEPSTLALLAAGTAGLVGCRLRRRVSRTNGRCSVSELSCLLEFRL